MYKPVKYLSQRQKRNLRQQIKKGITFTDRSLEIQLNARHMQSSNNDLPSTSLSSLPSEIASEIAVEGLLLNSSQRTSQSITAFYILDQSQKKIDEKLTTIISFLAELKLDLTEIKQRLDDVIPPKEACGEENLVMELPLKTLKHLEDFETLIQSNMDQKHIFVRYVFCWSIYLLIYNCHFYC